MKKSSSSAASSLVLNPSQAQLFRTMHSMREGLLQGAIATSSGQEVPEHVKEDATSRPRRLTQHILMSNKIKEELANHPYKFLYTVSLGFQPTAPVELVPENQVTIKDLMSHIGTAWLGKYFICRTIVWPMKQNAVQLVVEDTTETKVIIVSLYNCFLEEDFDPFALPRGTTLIIKNPWLKVASSGTIAIRVDNPGEVEINNKEIYDGWGPLDLAFNKYLGEESPKPNLDDKKKGNDYFREGQFHSAIRSYSKGIAANPKVATLYTNRAICYLNTGRPAEAIKDAEKALVLEPGNPKAIWRKSGGLARLNQHREALEFLKSHKVIVARNSELSTLKESLVKLYLLGRIYGKYDDLALLSETQQAQIAVGTHLNYMEYNGPVKIVEIPGKGRGIVLTGNVKKGDILIASRAFDLITQDALESKETVLSANVVSSIVNIPTYQRLIATVAHRLRNQPELCGLLYQLYAGPKFQPLDPNFKAKDQTQHLVDMERIERILNYNGFGDSGAEFPLNLKKDENAKKVWSGLWIIPSFINHSCTDANTAFSVHGDFMFIVAQKNMSTRTELLISYFQAKNMNFNERKEHIDRYGFTCTCRLCVRRR